MSSDWIVVGSSLLVLLVLALPLLLAPLTDRWSKTEPRWTVENWDDRNEG